MLASHLITATLLTATLGLSLPSTPAPSPAYRAVHDLLLVAIAGFPDARVAAETLDAIDAGDRTTPGDRSKRHAAFVTAHLRAMGYPRVAAAEAEGEARHHRRVDLQAEGAREEGRARRYCAAATAAQIAQAAHGRRRRGGRGSVAATTQRCRGYVDASGGVSRLRTASTEGSGLPISLARKSGLSRRGRW